MCKRMTTRSRIVLTLAAVAMAIVAGPAQAGTLEGELGILTPGTLAGNNPATGAPWAVGDTYRFAFFTSAKTTAESADIATYNTWVQGLANATTAYDIGADDGATWKAIGSTATVDARDNTSTNPTVETGHAIFLLDGSTLIASDYADLWDGEIQNIIDLTEQGTVSAHWPFTGTYTDGTSVTGKPTSFSPLGGGSDINQGNSSNVTQWIWRTWTSAPVTQELQMYALSDPLVILSDPELASAPNPADAQPEVLRDSVLSWAPGDFAAKHDVYFGTVFDDVNDASVTNALGVLAHQGQIATTYDPGRLDFGRTYYWRIDEVNAPPDSTIFKGFVWSFTVELLAYPIENVTATASSSSVGEGAENTVNDSGVDANDLHSTETTDMWRSSPDGDGPAWIEYEFDRVSKLHEMWVWNHNSGLEQIYGFGFKDVSIEYSADGIDYKALGTTHEFAQAPGTPGYAHETIDFEGAAAKYVRLTANSTWGSPLGGLSEVRFFEIPVHATEPYPDSGTTDVGLDVVLGWKAGRGAVSHDVYVGTDPDALTPAGPVTEPAFDTASLDLELGQDYHWRVDEVNDAETTTTWQSDTWSFSTPEYLVVEDFESYNDIEAGQEGSNLIYLTWADGFDNPPVNGSTIGYTEMYQPSMETSIVFDGRQSVPLSYNNTVATYSEVTANVASLQAGQDWSKYGIKGLTLRFYGDPNNAVNDRMYVKLNGVKVEYDGDAENLKRIGWQMWYIDLASAGVNLSNVTDLAIGFERIGAFGGQGMVLLDGIRLYSHDRQLITPVDPGTVGLQAHYEFEGNTNDSSGNARHGTIMGNPTFVTGEIGQAISFDGLSDFVNIDGYKGIVGDGTDTPPWSVTAWVRTLGNGEVVGWGGDGNGNRMEFRIDAGRTRAEGGGGNTQGDTSMNDGGWHHIAVTVQPNSVYSSGIDLWLDGQIDTTSNSDPDPWHPIADFDVKMGISYNESGREFTGSIDDVRIYDRVLTAEEIAWLAGRNQPFDRPF